MTSFCLGQHGDSFDLFALRKVKIVYNFGLSECNRVKEKNMLLGETERTTKMKIAELLCLCVYPYTFSHIDLAPDNVIVSPAKAPDKRGY